MLFDSANPARTVRRAVRLIAVLDGPFRGSEAVRRGLLTWNQLLGPRFQRVFPDIYASADLTLDLAIRSRAAALLVANQGGVLAGYSAAALLGADCAPLDAPAEVLVTKKYRWQWRWPTHARKVRRRPGRGCDWSARAFPGQRSSTGSATSTASCSPASTWPTRGPGWRSSTTAATTTAAHAPSGTASETPSWPNTAG